MTAAILIGVIAVIEVLHFLERRDLYSRIMSRDLTEYKQRKEPNMTVTSAHQRALKQWRGERE